MLPAGHHARSVALDDAEAVLALLNAASRAACGADDFTAGMLRKAWSAPGLQLSADTRLLLGPGSMACGYAELWWKPPGLVTQLWMAVAPAHPRRAALAAELLAWGEARARAHLGGAPAAPAGAELLLHLETDAGAPGAASALADRGFRRVRRTCRLERALASGAGSARVDPPAGTGWPAGLVLATLRPGVDEAAAFSASCEAFRDHWGAAESDSAEGLAAFTHWMSADPDFDPSLFWLLRDGAGIAAFLFAFPACGAARDTARIPSLGVLRPWRRRGLARRLLLHAFAVLERRGCARVVLEADEDNLTGALPLYEGAGMSACRRFETWEKVLRPGRRAITEAIAREV